MQHHHRSVAAMLVLFAMALPLGCASKGEIAGRRILTLDDANLSALALAGGETADSEPSEAGTLTALKLPILDSADASVSYSQAPAPNSAAGRADSLAVSGDGQLAIVAGPGQTIAGEPWTRLTLLDLSGDAVRVLEHKDRTDDASAGVSVSFHPFEPVAAVLIRSTSSLLLIDIDMDEGSTTYDVGLSKYLEEGDEPSSVAWHPTGQFIAVTLAGADAVALFHVERDDDGGLTIKPLGELVGVGTRPMRGLFSRDGRFFITGDTIWTPGDASIHVVQSSGSLSVVRISDSERDSAEHALVGRIRTPGRPDTFAISPDGDLIAVVTQRPSDLTAAPVVKNRHGGLLTLIAFDPITGAGRTLSQQRTCSMPTAVTFDTKGADVLVADFERGELQVWRVVGLDSPRLEFSKMTVETGAGPHAVVVTN